MPGPFGARDLRFRAVFLYFNVGRRRNNMNRGELVKFQSRLSVKVGTLLPFMTGLFYNCKIATFARSSTLLERTFIGEYRGEICRFPYIECSRKSEYVSEEWI